MQRDPLAIAQILARSASLRAATRRQVTGSLISGDDSTATVHALLDDTACESALEALTTLVRPDDVPPIADGTPATEAPPPQAEDAALVDEARSRRRVKETAEAKQIRYAKAQLAEAKAQVARLRGQLTTSAAELDAALNRARSAESDVADTQVELSAAKSDLTMARRQASDVRAAAQVLLDAAAPAPARVREDPRELEQQRLAGEIPALQSDAPANSEVCMALETAGVSAVQLRALLGTLISPPTPPKHEPVASTAQREFVVTPLGGGDTIGGSCILVEVGDVRILVDAGTRPKGRMSEAGPPLIAQGLKERIDAIVITHAHNDHAGFVPAVVAAQPHIPVFSTAGTAALLNTMWADSVTVFGHQTREDQARAASNPLSRINGGDFAPDQWREDNKPPFTTEQWQYARGRVVEVEVNRPVRLRTGVTLELFPAGHVLGACGVVVSADDRRVTVTGDVSGLGQRSVGGVIIPDAAMASDLLVIESTYCRRPDGHTRAHAVEAFISTVRETVDAGGRVLVPAFALGRAQEVALLLREHLPDIPVLMDGMAGTISAIYEEQTAGTARPLAIFGDNVERVRNDRRNRLIQEFRRGVVVTTSGMLSAGPAIPWARAILPDPNSALLVAGYQDEESPGAELLRLADDKSGAVKRFSLDGSGVDVAARVAKFSLSAHADRTGLTAIIDEVAPKRIMLVHGNPGPQSEYRDVLKARGNTPVLTGVWAARP